MDIFKAASQEKLRFNTTKGSLSTENLWDLSTKELDSLAVSLQSEYEQSSKKSFLVKRSAKDATAKLRFDIALEILNTKVAEGEAAAEKLENKQFNEKILGLIDKKREAEMENKSEKELLKMLRK